MTLGTTNVSVLRASSLTLRPRCLALHQSCICQVPTAQGRGGAAHLTADCDRTGLLKVWGFRLARSHKASTESGDGSDKVSLRTQNPDRATLSVARTALSILGKRPIGLPRSQSWCAPRVPQLGPALIYGDLLDLGKSETLHSHLCPGARPGATTLPTGLDSYCDVRGFGHA